MLVEPETLAIARRAGVIALALALSVTATLSAQIAPAEAELSARPISGVWVSELDFGPEVSGELEIRLSSDGLEATIQGHSTNTSQKNGEIRFELANDMGGFRGRLDRNQRQIVGHWVQPPSTGLGYPHATPIVLKQSSTSQAQESIYRGTVEPLFDRLHFYLILTAQESTPDRAAHMRVTLRNPERNLGLFMGLDRIELAGSEVEVLNRDGDRVAGGVWRKAKNQDEERLILDLPHVEGAIEFRRGKGVAVAAGIMPSLITVAYKYRAPREVTGGDERDWAVSSAAEEGVDPELLGGLVRELQTNRDLNVYSPYVHAVLVARHGKLILEQYFYTQQQGDTHDTRSAGKSLASMMVGAAIDRSDDFDTTTRFLEAFGSSAFEPLESRSDATFEQRSKWREDLDLGHLLSMSSGLDCDDDDSESPGNEGTMQDQSLQPDWVRYALDLPMARPPGQQALYCSNSINLAAAAMARKTGRWLPEAFAEWLAEPLGIERYHFNLSPAGDGYMGGGIRLTPRDQAKLGQVMLGGGVWKGKRVLSQEWVERSVSAHSSIHQQGDYGYAWWRTEYQIAGQKVSAFYASGNGGQLIVIVPELDMVVQFSAGNYGNFGTWRHFRDELVPKYVLAAAKR